MQEVAVGVLGPSPEPTQVQDMVREMLNVLDTTVDGKIRREAVMQALGQVQRRELFS